VEEVREDLAGLDGGDHGHHVAGAADGDEGEAVVDERVAADLVGGEPLAPLLGGGQPKLAQRVPRRRHRHAVVRVAAQHPHAEPGVHQLLDGRQRGRRRVRPVAQRVAAGLPAVGDAGHVGVQRLLHVSAVQVVEHVVVHARVVRVVRHPPVNLLHVHIYIHKIPVISSLYVDVGHGSDKIVVDLTASGVSARFHERRGAAEEELLRLALAMASVHAGV
jgi:hypothetical protein